MKIDRKIDSAPERGWSARLAAHAERAAARSARPLAARHRDRGHCAWARPRRPLERPNRRRACLLGGRACLLVETIAGALAPGLDGGFRLASFDPRRAGICHRRPDQPVQGGAVARLQAFEARLLAAIHMRFGLPGVLPPDITKLIKRADKIAAYYEATSLAGFSVEEARRYFGQPRGLSPGRWSKLSRLTPLPAAEARGKFLKRFNELDP